MAGSPAGDQFELDVVVIGGAATSVCRWRSRSPTGRQVSIYDLSESAVSLVNAGLLPFRRAGRGRGAGRVVAEGSAWPPTDPALVGEAETSSWSSARRSTST